MILHNFSRSSASYRVRIALALKGLPYSYSPVFLSSNQHLEPKFSELSAERLVPVLQLADGRSITQSLSIIEYLEEAYPDPPLLPPRSEVLERSQVRSLANIIACDTHPLNNLRVLRYLKHQGKFTEEQKQTWYAHWVRQGLESIEGMLRRDMDREKRGGGAFCLQRDQPSMADCFLIPQLHNALRTNVPFRDLQIITTVFDSCMKLDAFSSCQPSVEEKREAQLLSNL